MILMSAESIDTRMAHLEGAYHQIGLRLGGIEAGLDRLDTKLDSKIGGLRDSVSTKLDSKIDGLRDSLSKRIDGLGDGLHARMDHLRDSQDRRIDGLQWRLSALIIGTWMTTILAIVLHR